MSRNAGCGLRSLESPETGLTDDGSLRQQASRSTSIAAGDGCTRRPGAPPTTACCFRNKSHAGVRGECAK